MAAAGAGLARLGVALAPAPGAFAVFWPLSGFLLGALLLSPPRRWLATVAVAVGPVAALGAASGRPAALVVAFAGASALEALLGAGLAVRLCGDRPNLSRLGDVIKLVVAGPIVASAVASLVPAAALSRLSGVSFGFTVTTVWAGTALGSLAVAPVLLAWASEAPPPRPRALRQAEIAALVAAIAAIAWIIYGPGRLFRLPVSLFLPVLLWSALRFGVRGTTLSGLLVTCPVLWFTIQGIGRFAEAMAPWAGVLSAQVYAWVTLVSLLAMAAVIESRRLGVEALRRSEQQLRLVRFATDAASDPLLCLDPAGTLVYVNDALCALLRLDRRSILGQPLWSIVPTADQATWQRHWEEVKRQGSVTAELAAEREGGHPVPFEIRSSYLCFDGQEFCVSAARDLRERRQAEAALRLASIGTMAAGMAHEINNPLAYVIGNLEWVAQQVRRRCAADGERGAGAPPGSPLEPIEQALAETVEGAERIRDVVKDLKLFARAADGASRNEPADVVRALRGAVTLAQHEIRHRARLVQEYQELPPVAGSEHRLGQVFLNLILNAAQAIPEGHLAENLVRVAARRGAEDEVLVEVEDTGCGMSPQVLARIFDPFFTTKPVGFGTGLGLSICHGIVTSAGGRIDVSSRPERGSLFRVRLPVAREWSLSLREAAATIQEAGRR